VTNINLYPSSHRVQLTRSIGKIIFFDNGEPLVNALMLGNCCEYRYKSCIVKRFFVLQFGGRQYGYIFKDFDVIRPKATEFDGITQNRPNDLYADFGTNRKHICDFLLVIKLTSYLAQFPRYCRVLVKFTLSTWGTLF